MKSSVNSAMHCFFVSFSLEGLACEVIKKDAEQPKKKKVKKEIVRPTVKKEDIVKTDVREGFS